MYVFLQSLKQTALQGSDPCKAAYLAKLNDTPRGFETARLYAEAIVRQGFEGLALRACLNPSLNSAGDTLLNRPKFG
jgi:hypothetical protein